MVPTAVLALGLALVLGACNSDSPVQLEQGGRPRPPTPRTPPPSPAAPTTSTTDTAPRDPTAAAHLRAFDTHLRGLLAAGIPTATDGPSYVARVLSLQTFASAAIVETSTDPARAAARYAVIRTEFAVLLTQVGSSLGASITLPPPGPVR